MRKYGQFCPVAKSAEILGDSWALLIVRELLLGSSRFSTLQRGLPRISPTVLNTRLKELEENGVIVKRKLSGQRGHEYRLTPAGKELSSVVEALVVWGMRWARDNMDAEDMDVTFLMLDIQRNINVDELPGGETVLCFLFPDLKDFGQWWLVYDGADIDLCYQDPGKDVNVFVTASSRDLIAVWMGDYPMSAAFTEDRLQVTGETALCKSFRKWFPLSAAAPISRPVEFERSGFGDSVG
jgi:DNA-binding HxlR family transcriptional regulator